jgi:16S rRNA processing protein RimM
VSEIVRRAGTDERPIVRLAGFEGRAASAGLRGEQLLVPRAAAPALEEDEWWVEDLEGCRVVDGERLIGRVGRVLALPSCEVLEVDVQGGQVLVPLVRDAVRSVDVDARVIDVDVQFLGDTAPVLAAAVGTGEGHRGDASPGGRTG